MEKLFTVSKNKTWNRLWLRSSALIAKFRLKLKKVGKTTRPARCQFSSVPKSCLTLCNPMDCSTPGLLVHHQLPELAQAHVHQVGDAIQPSHPLSSPSPPAFNLSQNQGLLQSVSSLHQVAKVLEFQLQHQSFQRIFRTDFLWDGLVGSPCSPRDSQESSQTHSSKASILWCSAFFIVQLSHPYMNCWKNHSFD